MSKFNEAILLDVNNGNIDLDIDLNGKRHYYRYLHTKDLVGNGKKILDLGCGTGYGCEMLRLNNNEVTGVDYDREIIEYCIKTYPQCIFKVRSVLDRIDLEDQSFDVIICHAVFPGHGIGKQDHVINEAYRLLRKDGLFIISVHSIQKETGLYMKQLFNNVKMYKQVEFNISENLEETDSGKVDITYYILVSKKEQEIN